MSKVSVIVIVMAGVSIVIVMFEVPVIIITGVVGPIVSYVASVLACPVVIQGFILSTAGMLHILLSVPVLYFWC
jgi:hypothetical protein